MVKRLPIAARSRPRATQTPLEVYFNQPTGKPAGLRCVQLDDRFRCRIFGQPERPDVCRRLRPSPSMCGSDRDEALRDLAELDAATRPS